MKSRRCGYVLGPKIGRPSWPHFSLRCQSVLDPSRDLVRDSVLDIPQIRSILRMDLPKLSAKHLALSHRVDYESMTDARLQVHENSLSARRKIEQQIEGA